jgi:GDP-L-fucose synthase
MLQTYGEQYGMRGANLIPVNMYGPHDHFNLTSSHVIPALILKVYSALKNGDKQIELWGTGNASREFLYAPDCAEAIALAIKNDVTLEPMNIGNGEEVLIKDLAAEICHIMGYEGDLYFNPDYPDGQPRRCLDTTKAKEVLGFEAKTYWKDGLKQTIEWFMNDDNWETE